MDTKIIDDIKLKKLIVILIMIGLIILRYPFAICVNFHLIKLDYALAQNIYLNITYLLTIMIIFIEKENLLEFNITTGAVIIFLASPISKPLIYFLVGDYINFQQSIKFTWFEILVSVGAIIYMGYYNKNDSKRKLEVSLYWLIVSVLLGIITSLFLSYTYRHFMGKASIYFSMTLFLKLFISEMVNASIMEEPLFRGFIWGYLSKNNWNKFGIWLFQAGIFALGHIYYLPKIPIAVVGAFVCGLILGFLVWRSKSIGYSMICHGIINSVQPFLLHYL